MAVGLHQVAPIVYSSFWQALSRYDPDCFSSLLEELHTSREAVMRAPNIPRQLSDVPLREFLHHLYPLKSYPSIARLAGQIALAESAPHGFRPAHILLPSKRVRVVITQALELLSSLMPEVHYQQARRGGGGIFQLRGLPFIVPGLGRPTCGFVSGFVAAGLTLSDLPGLRVEEEACMSANENLNACVFQAGSGGEASL
ncbi:MAG: hypothetical protein B1H03_04835 [Planctomycetales bacterium 4484_113]|nr:MAG: hypothetical protein B1H03_04835 [Planctomycetales bacterium 4484_113]